MECAIFMVHLITVRIEFQLQKKAAEAVYAITFSTLCNWVVASYSLPLLHLP